MTAGTAVDAADLIAAGDRHTGTRTRTYVPLLPPRSNPVRHWLLPEGEVVGPHYDYATGQFTGSPNWSRPWTPDLTWHIASQVRGWCFPEQGQALYELARGLTAGAVVELGTAWGLSTVWLGWGLRASVRPTERVHCVDTFVNLPRQDRDRLPDGSSKAEFLDNMNYAGLRDQVVIHQELTTDAAATWTGGPVGLLYVDGWHTYKACAADHRAWEPHLAPGAMVGFDDCSPDFPGVLRHQRDLARDDRYTLVGRYRRMLVWQYQP